MIPAIKYDDFMKNIVERIRFYDNETLTESLMTMIKRGDIEQVGGNFYKYKNFHILELFKKDGNNYSQKLKTLDKLDLSITPKLVETIDKEKNVYIITQIQGTEKSNLTPLWKIGNQNISKENKLIAFKDLQKLTKAGFVDDRIAGSNELWYVNSDNKIILPNFDRLRPITPTDKPRKIIESYYNILFK